MKINFNVPPVVGNEEVYIRDAIKLHKICGDGTYTKSCDKWLEEKSGAKNALRCAPVERGAGRRRHTPPREHIIIVTAALYFTQGRGFSFGLFPPGQSPLARETFFGGPEAGPPAAQPTFCSAFRSSRPRSVSTSSTSDTGTISS